MMKYFLHSLLFIFPTLAVVVLGLTVEGIIAGSILAIIWVIIGICLTARDGVKNR